MQPDEPLDEKCTLCGNGLVKKHGRFGEFIGCSGYPKCKYTRPITMGIKCPKCVEGEFVRRGSAGKGGRGRPRSSTAARAIPIAISRRRSCPLPSRAPSAARRSSSKRKPKLARAHLLEGRLRLGETRSRTAPPRRRKFSPKKPRPSAPSRNSLGSRSRRLAVCILIPVSFLQWSSCTDALNRRSCRQMLLYNR